MAIAVKTYKLSFPEFIEPERPLVEAKDFTIFYYLIPWPTIG